MKQSSSNIISSIIAFALVALLSAFAGFRVIVVGAVIFSAIVAKLIVDSFFARVINKTKPINWMYWVWFAMYLAGILFTFITAKTGSNICAWITIALYVVGLVFQIIDAKKNKAVASESKG